MMRLNAINFLKVGWLSNVLAFMKLKDIISKVGNVPNPKKVIINAPWVISPLANDQVSIE